MMSFNDFSCLGYGLGLRTTHYEAILNTKPDIDWFEIITENYLVAGGRPLHYLEQIRQDYPMVMHGVSLSIGSDSPVDKAYLKKIKALANRIEAKWVSDHLCWTGIAGINSHDLLPIPQTQEAVLRIVEKIDEVQNYLGRQILLENTSSYVEFNESDFSESEFIAEIVKKADCKILLDINNIYVNSVNHRFDPIEYLEKIPSHAVQQFHLAGHTNKGDYIIDTHDEDIVPAVLDLYMAAVRKFGVVSTMIERDDNIPPLEDLVCELKRIKKLGTRVLAEKNKQALEVLET